MVRMVEFSAVPCIAVHCSAVRCSAVQCSAVQCSAVQCSAVKYQTPDTDKARFGAVPTKTVGGCFGLHYTVGPCIVLYSKAVHCNGITSLKQFTVLLSTVLYC